jgi:putative membrane protein
MAFTTFIDNLAFVEVMLLLAATILAYGGVLSWWAIRTNSPKGLRGVLRGMAVPLGAVGAVLTIVALWGEMTWPFLASDGLGGYNIFFFDPTLLLGLVLLAFAVSVYRSVHLQYVGLFALLAGGVVAFYGWTGYTATPAFTTDPFYTLLLYFGFAAAGVFAFPATVVVDYYLDGSDGMRSPFSSIPEFAARNLRRFGTRGSQPVIPGGAGSSATSDAGESPPHYHVPMMVQSLLLLFPIFMALAGFAALWYFGATLPGHLGGGAGSAP